VTVVAAYTKEGEPARLPLPADVAAVIDAWPALPEPSRAAILGLVKAALGRT
jgi:hypothetical protein